MQGKKHSKIEYLVSIFNAADADFNQKYRRNAVDYTPYDKQNRQRRNRLC